MAVVFFDRWRVFPATACVVDLTSLVDGSSEAPGKNMLPWGSGSGAVFYAFSNLYSTFLANFKALRRCKKPALSAILDFIFLMRRLTAGT